MARRRRASASRVRAFLAGPPGPLRRRCEVGQRTTTGASAAGTVARSARSWSTSAFQNAVSRSGRRPRPLVLADCLETKAGNFAYYLADELIKRADYRCVDTLAQFGQERRAVTREGQVRSGERHEKDDRTRVDDPRTWVLGWANERKIAALSRRARGAGASQAMRQRSRGARSRPSGSMPNSASMRSPRLPHSRLGMSSTSRRHEDALLSTRRRRHGSRPDPPALGDQAALGRVEKQQGDVEGARG